MWEDINVVFDSDMSYRWKSPRILMKVGSSREWILRGLKLFHGQYLIYKTWILAENKKHKIFILFFPLDRPYVYSLLQGGTALPIMLHSYCQHETWENLLSVCSPFATIWFVSFVLLSPNERYHDCQKLMTSPTLNYIQESDINRSFYEKLVITTGLERST